MSSHVVDKLEFIVSIRIENVFYLNSLLDNLASYRIEESNTRLHPH